MLNKVCFKVNCLWGKRKGSVKIAISFLLLLTLVTFQSSLFFLKKCLLFMARFCQSPSTGRVLSLADSNPELCGDLEQKTIEPLVIFCQKRGQVLQATVWDICHQALSTDITITNIIVLVYYFPFCTWLFPSLRAEAD